MIDKLKTFLFKDDPAVHSEDDALRFSVAVLLAEAGLMDGSLGEEECRSVQSLLANRFSLTDAEAHDLLQRAIAEAKKTTDLYGYARAIKDGFTYDERVEMMEMLWEVAYADGELHDYESNLMRRLTGLLYVEDQDSGSARKRVMSRLGLA